MKKFIKLILLLSLIFVWGESVKGQAVTWERLFDPNSTFNRAVQTNNNQFIVTGNKSIGNYDKFYTVKINEHGDTLWSFLYDTQINRDYRSMWIEQTMDKGFIMTGPGSTGSFSIAHLVKIDSSGMIKWWNSFQGSDEARGIIVKQTPDLGYGLLIYAYLPSNIMFVKTDSIGNMQWQKIYDSGGEDYPIGFEIMNQNGYLIISGYFQDPNIYFYLLRVNNEGDTLWTRRIYQTNRVSSYPTMKRISNNEIVIGGGNVNPFDSSIVIKMDTLGNIQWQKKYSAFGREICSSISDVPGRGIIMAGEAGINNSWENGMVRLLDYSGNIIFEKFYAYPNSELNVFRSVSPCSDNGFIISGYITPIGQNPRGYLLKTDSLGSLVDIQNNFEIINDYKLFQNYPNPFNPSTTISYYIPAAGNVKLSIYDLLGREMEVLVNERKFAGKHEIVWNTGDLSSGAYFYTIESGNFIATKKLLLLK